MNQIPEDKYIQTISELDTNGYYIIEYLGVSPDETSTPAYLTGETICREIFNPEKISYMEEKGDGVDVISSTENKKQPFKFLKVSNNYYNIINTGANLPLLYLGTTNDAGVITHGYLSFIPKTGSQTVSFKDASIKEYDLNNNPGVFEVSYNIDAPEANFYIKIKRIYSVTVEVKHIARLATISLPYGVRVPDEYLDEYTINSIIRYKDRLYFNEIQNAGLPAFSGAMIEYRGKSTDSSHFLPLIIDDSVGNSSLFDNYFQSATTCLTGFDQEKRPIRVLALLDDGVSFAKLGKDVKYLLANQSHVFASMWDEKTGDTVYGTRLLPKKAYIELNGTLSNNLLKSSGVIIPVETIIDTIDTEPAKERFKNQLLWHVTRINDKADANIRSAGRYLNDGTDSALIKSIKNI